MSQGEDGEKKDTLPTTSAELSQKSNIELSSRPPQTAMTTSTHGTRIHAGFAQKHNRSQSDDDDDDDAPDSECESISISSADSVDRKADGEYNSKPLENKSTALVRIIPRTYEASL